MRLRESSDILMRESERVACQMDRDVRRTEARGMMAIDSLREGWKACDVRSAVEIDSQVRSSRLSGNGWSASA